MYTRNVHTTLTQLLCKWTMCSPGHCECIQHQPPQLLVSKAVDTYLTTGAYKLSKFTLLELITFTVNHQKAVTHPVGIQPANIYVVYGYGLCSRIYW